jgi:hypothetical protein
VQAHFCYRSVGKANPKLFKEPAFLVTFDEGGGGYWDSGFMQPLDFFGTARASRWS